MQNWIFEPSNSYLIAGDLNANYYLFPYVVDPDVEIVIKGEYPFARYMSITAVGENDISLVGAQDYEIIPDPGSSNPFMPGANWNAENRNYTLVIRFTAPPPGSSHFVPEAGNNTIYVGTFPDGRPNTRGNIDYRLYVPSIGYDKFGGVGLPTITYCAAKKDKRHPIICSAQDNTGIRQNTLHDWSNHANKKDVSQYCDLTWSRSGRLAQLLQTNPQTVYIESDFIERDPCKFLFMRWKAPTFPDTYHNIGIVGNEDMRYWGMSFTSPIGFIGLYTIGDFQTIIDKNGFVNLVISFGAPRPSCVTSENGFTWVDLSQLPLIPFQIIYRNTLISQFFPFTAKDVPAGQVVPPEVMGEYYPCGKYISPLDVCCNLNSQNRVEDLLEINPAAESTLPDE